MFAQTEYNAIGNNSILIYSREFSIVFTVSVVVVIVVDVVIAVVVIIIVRSLPAFA